MDRIAISLTIFLALSPMAQAQPAPPEVWRTAPAPLQKPVSCGDIQETISRLGPEQDAERNRLQALYRSRGCIDPAFTRRLKLTVETPLPDAAQREEMWRKALPQAPAPTSEPDPPPR